MSKDIAIVTGGAQGIGASIVHRLLADGYEVFVLDKNERSLTTQQEGLKPKLKKSVFPVTVDISDPQFIEKIDHLVPFSKVKVLINNAGYGGPFESIDQVSSSTWEQVFGVNVRALFLISKSVLPGMKKRGFGRIINISSIQGLVGSPGSTTYVAAKHAVVGYTKAIAAEWGSFGITCNAIAPGYVDTAMGVSQKNRMVSDYRRRVIARTPVGKIGTPDDVSRMASFLWGADAGYLNGAVIAIDGGISSSLGL